MRRAITLPKLGLTMTEGLVSEWSKQPGEAFVAGESLYVVENDKVANEIEAEADGVLLEILVAAGDSAPVGATIGYWDDPRASADEQESAPPAQTPASSAPAPVAPQPTKGPDTVSSGPVARSVAANSVSGGAQRVIASPYARKLARDHELPLAAARGTGPNGRIVARDVEAALRTQEGKAGSTPSLAAMPLLPGQTLTPVTTMQATVARRLTASKREIPHFYLALDVDATRMVSMRREINAAQDTYRLTFNHFIVMAVARALRQMPQVNRVWTENGILAFNRIDVGVAVNTDAGLFAPAVCDVGSLTLGEFSQQLDGLVERVRAGRMTQDDVGQAAITVSNAGMHDVRYMTSIINPGQAMILGVGSIKPTFLPDGEGKPELHQQMGIVLSADHRILDGVQSLAFVNLVRGFLEQPARLLLD